MTVGGSRERDLEHRFDQALRGAATAFHRLILVVGPLNSGKTRALCALRESRGLSLVNLNLDLCRQLLELNGEERSLDTTEILGDLIEAQGATLILDNTEILFERALALDPLRSLQALSRNRTIIASWAGAMSQGRLTYAELGHPEFRSYSQVDAFIIDLEDDDLAEK